MLFRVRLLFLHKLCLHELQQETSFAEVIRHYRRKSTAASCWSQHIGGLPNQFALQLTQRRKILVDRNAFWNQIK